MTLDTGQPRGVFCLIPASGALLEWTKYSLASRGIYMGSKKEKFEGTLEDRCQERMPLMVGAENSAQTSKQAKEGVESANTVERSDANCPNNPTEASNPVTSMSVKRLTGSAKSRLKALRGLGVAHEEALQLSAKSFAELKKMGYKFESSQSKPEPKSAKRPCSEEKSPQVNTSKKPRASETLPTQPQPPQPYNEVRSQLRVGIKDSKPMSNAQLGSLSNTILQKIATLEMGEGPKFKGYSYKPGWLLITCSDQRSKAWLEQITPTLKPWPEASLGIIPENELPKPNIGMVFIPEIDDSMVKQSLSLIYAQNQGLHTELWKILHTKVEKSGVMVTLSLDDKSLENLKKKGLKANLGFREVQFRLKGQPKTQQPETQSTQNPQPQSANPTPPTTIIQTTARKGPSGPNPKRAAPSTSNPTPGPSELQRPCNKRGGYRGNYSPRGRGNERGHQGHNSAQRRGK
ncbi:uncharacterized protein LOC134751374 [Cydia strobilella]|uniref:uncharacterized protein LOC134751374 n=1 Tax=Cydia strobilella TaxID=1100964 RepID=UPI003005381F